MFAYILRVLVEAGLDKLLELLGKVARELGRVVLGYEEEDPHGVEVRVGRLTLQTDQSLFSARSHKKMAA